MQQGLCAWVLNDSDEHRLSLTSGPGLCVENFALPQVSHGAPGRSANLPCWPGVRLAWPERHQRASGVCKDIQLVVSISG